MPMKLLLIVFLLMALATAAAAAEKAVETAVATEAAETPVTDLVIPTLGEWALIIFAVMLAGFMAWALIRRRNSVESGL